MTTDVLILLFQHLFLQQVVENKFINQDPYVMVHYSYCMNDTNIMNSTDFYHPYTDMITWNLTFLTQVRTQINYILGECTGILIEN